MRRQRAPSPRQIFRDRDEAGGLCRVLPLTCWSFLAAALALAGIPPTAGFFSKDLVLEAAFHRHALLGACATLVAAGSGLYIGRMAWLTFFGDRAEQAGAKGHTDEHPHPGDPWLLLPAAALAFLSVVAGLALAPTGVLRRLILAAPLWSGEPFPHRGFDWGLAIAGIGAAFAGLALSWYLAMAKPSWDWSWRKARPRLAAFFDADFGWQTAVTRLAAKPVEGLAAFVGLTFDHRTLDRFIEASADSFIGLSEGLSGLSRGLLNDYLWWMAAGAALFVARLVF